MPVDPVLALRARVFAVLGLVPLAACYGAEDANGEGCVSVEEGVTECPSADEVRDDLEGDHCGYTTVAVVGEGTFEAGGDTGYYTGDRCCYPVVNKDDPLSACVVGRPYVEDGAIVTAGEERRAGGWRRGRAPKVAGLTAAERRVLAEAWSEDARTEHAAVAAFARFAMELMAHGAPADLVAEAHRAALDEVRHAKLAFAIASGYAGEELAPGAFPFGAAVPLAPDLPSLAAAVAREGCVGESVVALLAADALARATDPAVRATLAVIARDEARHAELAWRTLRWAIEVGGEPVREAVAAVFAEVARVGIVQPDVTTGAAREVLDAHGRIGEADTVRGVARALREVVLPAGFALAGRRAA
ncbi:MAG: ferritin-like domain-containing protein [Myxococcota bacterium]